MIDDILSHSSGSAKYKMQGVSSMNNRTVWLCVVLLTMASRVEAQIPQGSMNGCVADPTMALVHGADVVLENQATGVKRTAEASAEGLFNFNYLDSGAYRLTVRAKGFKTAVLPDIHVAAGAKVRVDVRLEVGDVSTLMEVTGSAAL